jgi:hypothetical protein
VQDAILEIEETLEGADLAEVAEAAQETGHRALSTNLFRPADGWSTFKHACDGLQVLAHDWNARSPVTNDAGVDPASEAIRMQSWCRAVITVRRDLGTVKNSIAETEAEARYRLSGDSGTTDLGDDIVTKATAAAHAVGTIAGPAGGERK